MAADLIGRHIWNTHLKPQEAVADKGYGRRYLYAFLKQAGILPSIPYPKPRKTMRRKKLEVGFVYDEKEDVYYCPQGKKMYSMANFPMALLFTGSAAMPAGDVLIMGHSVKQNGLQ